MLQNFTSLEKIYIRCFNRAVAHCSEMLCSVSDLRLQAILLYSISSHSANCAGSPHRFQERTVAGCKAECCGPKTTCWVITSSVLFYLVPLFTTRKRERGKLQITIPDIHTLSYITQRIGSNITQRVSGCIILILIVIAIHP